MKLFRHYKNKFYTYVGTVCHSETQEELVLYETRYESRSGKTWVRPKSMFFESVVHEGVVQPRFAPLELEVRCVTEFTADDIALVASLSREILGDGDTAEIEARLRDHERPLLVLGAIEGRPVGFKLGYEAWEKCHYSWLGGVLPDYRGLGFAARLMNAQHAWAFAHGYERVRTKTLNRWRGMLLLNIREGFQIIATEAGSRGLKIVLEKELASAATTPK